MDYRQMVGSYTARGGFENENDIVEKFNQYKTDNEAQLWLKIMGYDYLKIQQLKARQIPPRINKETALSLGVSESNLDESAAFKKADVQIKLEIIIDEIYYIENISIKKANVGAGFNQVDKRPVNKYKIIWDIPDSVCETLQLYTGDLLPMNPEKVRDERRMFLDEMEKEKVEELKQFFTDNKTLVVNDVLRGRGSLSADWFLVTRRDGDKVDWILKDINFVCNYFSKGTVEVTDRGNLKIGKMTAQRKGGTPDPKSLQFKINPLELFDIIDNSET